MINPAPFFFVVIVKRFYDKFRNYCSIMLQERGAFVFRLENNYKNFLHKFSPKCKVKFEKSLTKFRCWVGFFSTKISIFSFDPNFEVGLDFFPPKYLFLVSTQISIKILLSTNKFTTKFSIVSIL